MVADAAAVKGITRTCVRYRTLAAVTSVHVMNELALITRIFGKYEIDGFVNIFVEAAWSVLVLAGANPAAKTLLASIKRAIDFHGWVVPGRSGTLAA